MAKDKTKDSEKDKDKFVSLKEETIQGVVAVLLFVFGAFFILASLDKAGMVGKYVYAFLNSAFGFGYFLLPLILIALGISFLRSLHRKFDATKIVGSILFFLSGLGTMEILFPEKTGIVGYYASYPFLKLFDFYAGLVFMVAILMISILITFDAKLSWSGIISFFAKTFSGKDAKKGKKIKISGIENGEMEEDDDEKNSETEENVAKKKTEEKNIKSIPATINIKKPEENKEASEFDIKQKYTWTNKVFTPPPLSILEKDRGKPGVGDIKANANIIKRTLQNFGIDVEMDEISIGPSVTRYALKPAEGVKLSRIVALQNDLALALAAHPIRIEAPIPGKSLVGIEIPNSTKTTVGLGSMLGGEEFQHSEKSLLVALGKSVTGKSHFANLAKMPHLLIAGATGSGKSVTIHTIISSLLYRNSPENLKFIMIDPKRVELTLYNKIPHLLTPVITEAKKTILALKWAAKEMDRRYDILQAESVRDIESYHKTVLGPALKKYDGKDPEGDAKLPEVMPYIVIVVDELADIMSAYPRELEAAIVRLAQMSRAVGIHLILSTQRPSVNVITGLIKANVPARIALQVSSQIDSRTILDTGGAEKLLGAGDMLYLSGEMSKPLRIQSAFISESEVKSVVKYLADAYRDELQNEINISSESAVAPANAIFESSFDSEDSDIDDDLYEEAKQIVIEAGKASTSYIQRKLRVGYARAARLMDILEEKGVIGPADGSKPRPVILSGIQGSSQGSQNFEENTENSGEKKEEDEMPV